LTAITAPGGMSTSYGAGMGGSGTVLILPWAGPSVEPVGTGSSWTNGTPRVLCEPPLAVGIASDLVFYGNPPNQNLIAVLALNERAVPIDLQMLLNFPRGSMLYLDAPLVSLALFANSAGVARFSQAAIPNIPTLIGSALFAQSLIFDPALPPISEQVGVSRGFRLPIH